MDLGVAGVTYKYQKRLSLRQIYSLCCLIDQEWDVGKRRAKPRIKKICGLLYAFDIYKCSNEFVIAVLGKRLIGAAIAGEFPQSKRFSFRCALLGTVSHIMKLLFICDRQGLREYYDVYNYAPKFLNSDFDCELNMLILNNAYRGKAMGRDLFNTLGAVLRKRGLVSLKIDTDDSCNKQFYELLGCNLVHEALISGGEQLAEHAYVYKYLL